MSDLNTNISNLVTEDYGSAILSGWLRQNLGVWEDYTRHEFVRGLGDGRLPRSAFMAYLIQDYIFLLHYSRAWAMAVVKSETAEQMRSSAATVHGLINQEIQLHIGICAREGISESELIAAEEAPENLAYTRYVMDTALSGDLLDLLSVLAPCVFGYGHIGLALASEFETTPLYREWIDTYYGDEYQQMCRGVASLIDQVAQSRLGDSPESNPRWPGLCQKFGIATRLEVSFWSMGLRLG
jgi:thiaminase/transcriptional activator TenA